MTVTRYFLVRINGRNTDIFASTQSVEQACERGCAAAHDSIEWASLYTSDLSLSRFEVPVAWKPYYGLDGEAELLKRTYESHVGGL